MLITDSNVRAAVIGYMNGRCDVSSQHKLPTRDEFRNTVMAEILGEDRVLAMVEGLVAEGVLMEYGPYLSDHQIDVL